MECPTNPLKGIGRELTRVYEYQSKNIPYIGQSGQQLGGSGREPIIKQGSMEEHGIADWIE